MRKIAVLDHGYVKMRDYMGSDLTPVNAARVSFLKESLLFGEADERLLAYLVEHKHLSVFRHCMVQLEFHAPLMVARQIWRYTVGAAQQDTLCAWNEASRRYITEELEWYVPDAHEWRGAPDSKKQGSKGTINGYDGIKLTEGLKRHVEECVRYYEWALDCGVAVEQARVFLPSNCQYTTWMLTASLQAIVHFLEERGDPHAMWETRLYAKAVYELVRPLFERCMDTLLPGFEVGV